MPHPLAVIGAPSSAGAYAPGQEKAPHALRAAGLIEKLRGHGLSVEDRGDVAGFRWRADAETPRAMNLDAVARVARATAVHVAAALSKGARPLVLGGDCTVEIGTVAGARATGESVGLVYVDFDTDLNTPESTTDGALDWMGVAHLLGIEGTTPELVNLGSHAPLLGPDQVLFFGNGNSTLAERRVIEANRMVQVPATEVAADPAAAARFVLADWARRFDRLLIHLDVDVLDFLDLPLAENTRRNVGLKLDQLMIALTLLLAAPNFAALTICEVNPDHGTADGSTLASFVDALADSFAEARRIRIAALRGAT